MGLLNDIYKQEMAKNTKEKYPNASKEDQEYYELLKEVNANLGGKYGSGIDSGGTGIASESGSQMSVADALALASSPPNAYVSGLGNVLGTVGRGAVATIPGINTAYGIANSLFGQSMNNSWGNLFNTQQMGLNALSDYGVTADDIAEMLAAENENELAILLSKFGGDKGESPIGAYDARGNPVNNDFTGFTYGKNGEPTGFQFGAKGDVSATYGGGDLQGAEGNPSGIVAGDGFTGSFI